VSVTTINCLFSLINQKLWSIYTPNSYGVDEQNVVIYDNPTINYAELVLQPQTLSYGFYRFIYSVTMSNNNLTSKIDTFVKVIPSGLVISALRSSQPMYGGTIEITRGIDQQIQFDPFLNSYDIDSVAVMTSLTFRYSCQIIDSNIQAGYPLVPGTNQMIFLDDFKYNSTLSPLDTCFNSTGWINNFIY